MFLENHNIRMISEGCDTEDWSNGCWKFSFAKTGLNCILKYTKTENGYLNCNNISQYTVFTVSYKSYNVSYKSTDPQIHLSIQ